MIDRPITPPPELLQQWMTNFYGTPVVPGEACTDLATRAAQYGADQELEALLVWLRVKGFDNLASDLLSARRPKPPSLKEQAIAELDDAVMRGDCITVSDALDTIRRALESLPDD